MAKLFEMLSKEQSDKMKKIGTQNKKESPHSTKPPKSNSDTFIVKIPDFIAIDLETTGLNKRGDRITEIGAIKYINGKETESFSTLINPLMPIPANIVRLTGITDDMVASAPTFEEIMADLLKFIGRLPLCAHRIDFDFNFLNAELKRNGETRLKNPQIDTLSTSRVVLDLKEGYALGKVARALQIPLQNAHRATDDARACGEIALRILPKLGELPPQTRKKLARFAPYSFTKKILESSAKNIKWPENERNFPPIKAQKPQAPREYLLSEKEMEEFYCEGGALDNILDGYHFMKDQLSYAIDVAKALNSGTITAIEAGTGTGKSLAYALPAAKWAMESKKRVVISTNTKNLQDQLGKKELPLIRDILGKEFSYAILKGKSNYLCLKAWDSFLRGETGTISAREREAVMPLITWADRTTLGDIEEQNTFNPGFNKQIWQLISAESKNCSNCSLQSDCFMLRARKRAMSAQVVVINHSLFYSDVLTGTGFVGNADALIIDEAHQLEGTGHRSMQVEIDTRRMDNVIEFVQEALNTIKPTSTNSEDEIFTTAIQSLRKVLKRLRKNSDEFLKDLKTWITKHQNEAEELNNGIATISYSDHAFRSSGGLAGLKIALDDMVNELDYLKQVGRDALKETIAMNEVRTANDMVTQLRADLVYLCEADYENNIFWASGPVEKAKWVKITGATLDVDTFLHEFWKQFENPILFTSATLSPKKDLAYFCKRVGIEQLNPVVKEYETHFDLERTKFVALTDSPLPSDENYHIYVADTLEALKKKYGKNILVLFTNNNFLQLVFEELTLREEVGQHEVFAQRISGNRSWIQEQMSEVEGAILLGSGSFWEGVDIPGEGCEIVVIPKLPFPVPSHPLSKALAERAETEGRNGFIDYFMPEALLKFKQGAGRLIRHKDDRGVLLVMDSRMTNKPYGKKFIKLLPQECNLKPLSEAIDEIGSFFAE